MVVISWEVVVREGGKCTMIAMLVIYRLLILFDPIIYRIFLDLSVGGYSTMKVRRWWWW